MTTAHDAGYESLRRELVWNQFTPARYPALICQVATEHDVSEAVKFARTHRMKVAVRGGGHNMFGFCLRDHSLLIDLGRLSKIISIDERARTAVIQPTVRGRELNSELNKRQLAFPVGHCPSVPLSGFLLNGGLGWNFGRWGPACLSVESARVVTAGGEVILADGKHHPDLLWAIRGGGPGFFGVITQYRLKIYSIPRAIRSSDYFYPLDRIDAVGAWAASVAGKLPDKVELTLFCTAAPPQLAEGAKSANGFVVLLDATAFTDTESEAAAALAPLESAPQSLKLLSKSVNQPTTINGLLDLDAEQWPEHHRYLEDTIWTNTAPAQPLLVMRDHFLRAPSRSSVALCVFATSGEHAELPDAAFSMTAKNLILCYAIWERPEDDTANTAWLRNTMAALDPFAVGHYVGESDIVASPVRAERSFAAANYRRLQSLRRTYDPGKLFLGQFAER